MFLARQIKALSRELAQQTRELAEQKAQSMKLAEQVGDMNALQVIQAAKKTQKKGTLAKGKGKKASPAAKRKKASPGGPSAKRTKKASPAAAKKASPAAAKTKPAKPAASPLALTRAKPVAKNKKKVPKFLLESSSSDSSSDDGPTPEKLPPPAPREICDTCACNFKTCQHDNYDTGYFREDNIGYFNPTAKYGGCKCCGCYRMLVAPVGKKDSVEWAFYTEESIYIIVTRKVGVRMCNNCTGNGKCRHMFCEECFNGKLGLTGSECQYAEPIGVAARMRSKRNCSSTYS